MYGMTSRSGGAYADAAIFHVAASSHLCLESSES